ncbi:hypothetical protein [Marinibacterium sp. SX1]|uniref:hypothetical protein n=1 Tax=Marinibacterium sp. SX1 TaxID=3388424 RepID=UPI003D16D1FF
MPDDQSPAVELTIEQMSFVSRYLKVIPKKGWTKKKSTYRELVQRIETANDRIKRNYLEFDRLRDTVTALVSEMERESDELSAQYQAAAKVDARNRNTDFETALKAYRDRLAQLKKTASEKAAEVETAPVDAPLFDHGKQSFGIYQGLLNGHRNGLPDLPPPVVRSGIGPILRMGERVAAMRALDGVGGMTREMAEKALEDGDADARRAEALEGHDQVCDQAGAAIALLVEEALEGGGRTDAQLRDVAERVADGVAVDCAPYLADLREVLNAQAVARLAALQGDDTATGDIARRETFRLDQITARTGRLDTAITALDAKVDQLLVDKTNATGFNEKRDLAARYEAEKARLGDLKARRAQLEMYTDQLAGRLARLDQANDDYNGALDLAQDPAAFLAALDPLPAAPEGTALLLLGGQVDGGGYLVGQIAENRERYDRALNRVAVQDQLFLGEESLTDISAEQHAALHGILDKAEAQIEDGRVAEGKALVAEADRLYFRFLGANKFPLPDLPDVPPSRADQTERDIKRLSVRLDRFWGRGGDGDEALRGRLDGLIAARGDALTVAPISLATVEDGIRDFEKALDAAERGFVVNPQDQEAREAAGAAGNDIRKGLLDLFRTHKVDEANVGKVPPDRLLVIDNDDGTRSYHEIEAHKSGTEPRRKTSHIPREAMQMLLDKARMLEALAACESPDCADMITEAVTAAQGDLAAIKGGAKDYDHIAEQLRKCDVLLGHKLFAEWLPAGFGETKAGLETFRKGYVTKMKPAEARAKVDEIHQALTGHKAAAEALKTRYKEVSATLTGIETDLAGGRSAASDGLARKLEALVKAGPDALVAGLDRDGLDQAEETAIDALIATLRDDMVLLAAKARDSKALEGRHATRLGVAWQTIESKTADGIDGAERIGTELRQAMTDEMAELAGLDVATGGADALRRLATFLGGAAKGHRDKDTAEGKAETARSKLRTQLDTAKSHLKKNRKRMTNYREYKAIYDSLDKQYEQTKHIHEKSGDADAALSQYKMQLSTAEELNAEMGDTTGITGQDGGSVSTEFISQFGAAVVKNLGHTQEAAAKTGGMIKERAEEDADQKADAGLQGNVDAVRAVLALVGRDQVKALATLKASARTDVDDALALPTTHPERKKRLALAREGALAAVRDIRAGLDADPALKVYRDNPFDKGAAWPAVVAALHDLETRIIRDLDPAKL